MNRFEVRNKLRKILREMLLSDLESDYEIPQAMSDYILENYGCIVPEKSNLIKDLESFVKRLQKWIEDHHLPIVVAAKLEKLDYNVEGELNKYLDAESEYFEVTSELVLLVDLMMQQKDNYSEYFKEKCRAEDTTIDMLNAKCQLLKLQSLLKLFGEGEALCGHCELHVKLKMDLELLKKSYSELLEHNELYDKIKYDKNFCELYDIYRELKKIEKRSEIIRQM